MSILGITRRRKRNEPPPIRFLGDNDLEDVPVGTSSGIGPRPAPRFTDADFEERYPSNPAEFQPNVPAETATPSPSRRAAAPSYTPATSLSDEDALRSVVATRSPKAREPGSREANVDELSSLRNNEARDRNGRGKSALWNAFLQMSEQANRLLASGRPVDEYGLASVAGSGLGGGIRGAIDPKVDDEYKRRARMADLERSIAQQLKIEEQQAETAKREAEAEYYRQKPANDAAAIRARSKAPKPFILGGKRINYRRPEGWDPESGDPNDWEPYEETVKIEKVPEGQKLIEDKSKVAGPDGLLPADRQRAELAAANNKFKAAESEKERAWKGAENEKDRGLKRAALREQIRSHLENEKNRRTAPGQGAQRVRISLANAKIQASSLGVPLSEYIDALSDNDVEVYKDK